MLPGWLGDDRIGDDAGEHGADLWIELLAGAAVQLGEGMVRGQLGGISQTTATVIGCVGCGVRATPHGRRTVRVRDLPVGGRPVVLAWRTRL